MTLTLTAAATTATARQHAAPRFLMELEFSLPSPLLLRLADQPLLDTAGAEWSPLLADVVTIDEEMNDLEPGGRPATATFTFFNDRPVAGRDRLSDLLRTPRNPAGYRFFAAKATLYEVLSPSHGLADRVTLGVFYLEDPEEIGEWRLVVRASDLAGLIERQCTIPRITEAEFPHAAPSAKGRSIPAVFGAIAGLRCPAIVAGQMTTLTADHTAAVTILSVKSTSGFPPAGTVQVNGEHVGYAALTPTSFTGCTRASNGTTAAAHVAGDGVFEVRTGTAAYRYAVALNRLGGVQSVTNVRINGSPKASGYTVRLKATETRSALPIAGPQSTTVAVLVGPLDINVAAAEVTAFPTTGYLKIGDEILSYAGWTNGSPDLFTGVSRGLFDTTPGTHQIGAPIQQMVEAGESGRYTFAAIDFDVTGDSDDVRTFHLQPVAREPIEDSTGTTSGGPTTAASGTHTHTRTFPALPSNLVISPGARVRLKLGISATRSGGTAPSSLYCTYVDASANPQSPTVGSETKITDLADDATAFEPEVDIPWYPNTQIAIRVTWAGIGGGSMSSSITFGEIAIAANNTTAAGSTAEAVIGEVTCDVVGIADDAAGTASGSGGATLEYPSDVTRAILLTLFPGTRLEDFDAASWREARAKQIGAGIKWAFALEWQGFGALRAELDRQSRSMLSLDNGRWRNVYLDEDPPPDQVLDYTRDLETVFSPRRTPRFDTVNTLYVSSARDYSTDGETYDRVTIVQDLAQALIRQPGANLDDVIQRDLVLSFVQDARAAASLGQFWLGRLKRQRFIAECTAAWNVLARQKGDVVTFSGHPILAAHGGADLLFRIVARRHLGDGRIGLRAVEANT